MVLRLQDAVEVNGAQYCSGPKGLFEGLSRILRELLKTPRVTQSIRVLLGDLDPQNAALLVRTLIWQDPILFLDLVSTFPRLANAVVAGAKELAQQLLVYPSEMVHTMLPRLIEDLSARGLGTTAGLLLVGAYRLTKERTEELEQALKNFGGDFTTGFNEALAASDLEPGTLFVGLMESLSEVASAAASVLGQAAAREGSATERSVKALVDGLRRLGEENPELVRAVLRPLIEAGGAAFDGQPDRSGAIEGALEEESSQSERGSASPEVSDAQRKDQS